jgi:hypothetical protein
MRKPVSLNVEADKLALCQHLLIEFGPFLSFCGDKKCGVLSPPARARFTVLEELETCGPEGPDITLPPGRYQMGCMLQDHASHYAEVIVLDDNVKYSAGRILTIKVGYYQSDCIDWRGAKPYTSGAETLAAAIRKALDDEGKGTIFHLPARTAVEDILPAVVLCYGKDWQGYIGPHDFDLLSEKPSIRLASAIPE